MDNRAQSIGIARFFLSLGVGAIVYWIADLVTTPVLAGAYNATGNATANQATQWFEQSVNAMPLAFALISFVGIIALSVFQREILR
jgi:uncharacterized membrane protein YhdT